MSKKYEIQLSNGNGIWDSIPNEGIFTSRKKALSRLQDLILENYDQFFDIYTEETNEHDDNIKNVFSHFILPFKNTWEGGHERYTIAEIK